MRLLRAAIWMAGVFTPATAGAERWLVAETPAALAISAAQDGVYRTGVMPAVGAYADNSKIALGIRLRAGILRNGPAPAEGDHLRDPGTGGLITGSLALRALIGPGWVEATGGGGFTGGDFVPAVELGAGIGFGVADRFEIGPSLRYVRVISRDDMDTFGSADLLLVGVDVRFGKRSRPAPPPVMQIVAAPPPPVAPPPPLAPPPPIAIDIERDLDAVVERETSCATELDGCRLSDAIIVVDDRIILDERVLFDTNFATVRGGGQRVVAELARLWRDRPEWKRLTIEGHADDRGTDQFNLDLSQRRAASVRALLLAAGFPADNVSAVGYGRSRPRDLGTTAEAYRRNRRVEFVIERSTLVGGTP